MTREQFIGELERLTMLAFREGMSEKSCKLLAKVHKYERDIKERDDEGRRIREASEIARYASFEGYSTVTHNPQEDAFYKKVDG